MLNLYEPWSPSDLPPELYKALSEAKQLICTTHAPWLTWAHPKQTTWAPAGNSPLATNKLYKLVAGASVPESLRRWIKSNPASSTPRSSIKPRRFRTLVDNYMSTELPKGSVFTLVPGSYKMHLDDPRWKRYDWQSGNPDNDVEARELEEIFFDNTQQNTKEQTTMTPIKIEKNVTLINGNRPAGYPASERAEMLGKLETEVKRLEALEFKTQETLDEIAALRANAQELITIFDEDYAARKATKTES